MAGLGFLLGVAVPFIGLVVGAIWSAFRGQYEALPRVEAPARIPTPLSVPAAPVAAPAGPKVTGRKVAATSPLPVPLVPPRAQEPARVVSDPDVLDRLNRLMAFADAPVGAVEPAPVGMWLRVPGVVTSVRPLRQGGYTFTLEDPRHPGVRVPVWVSEPFSLPPAVGQVVLAGGVRWDGRFAPGLVRGVWSEDPALLAGLEATGTEVVH